MEGRQAQQAAQAKEFDARRLRLRPSGSSECSRLVDHFAIFQLAHICGVVQSVLLALIMERQ
jgi:hypothetical protein